MKIFNRSTGNKGEEIAARHLINNGYQIIEKNFRTKFGEIDIICKNKNQIIFVEVKTKITDNFGLPEEMINRNKLSKIRKMAEVYLTSNHLNNSLCRIDVITIVLGLDGTVTSLNHYENLY